MPATLSVASRGFWRPILAVGELVPIESVIASVADQSVNPNEVYVGEKSQPLAVRLDGLVDFGLNAQDFRFRVNVKDRDTDTLVVDSGVAVLSFVSDRNESGEAVSVPVLSYQWADADVAAPRRCTYQFRIELVSDPSQRLILDAMQLVIRTPRGL